MEAHAGKYLTFTLFSEEYGLEILKVREIIGHMEATAMPQVPGYVKGVINLRGQVIPVFDLRLKFCMMEAEVTDKTCIVVTEVSVRGKSRQVGIVVDSVSEVIDISKEIIEPTPEFGTTINQNLIMGLAKIGDRIVILLDVDRVLFEQDMFSEMMT